MTAKDRTRLWKVGKPDPGCSDHKSQMASAGKSSLPYFT